jgi:signal transduction histidine kinase
VVRSDRYLPEHPPPPADAQWRDITLPAVFVPHRDESAQHVYYTWLRVRPTQGVDRFGALYVPRLLHGSHPQIASTRGWSFDDGVHSLGPTWNTPLRILFLPELLASPSHLDFGFSRRGASSQVISALWLDRVDGSTLGRYRLRYFLQQDLPRLISATLLVFALFAVGYWALRREPLYLIAAAAMAAWCVRLVHYYVRGPVEDVPADWFWWASTTSMLWVMHLTYLFALRLHELSVPTLERGMLAFTVAVTLATTPLVHYEVWRSATVIYLAAATMALLVTGAVTWHFVRSRGRAWGLMAAALWASVAMGVHDLGLRSDWIDPHSIYLMPLSALLIFGVFAYTILERYAGAIGALERSNVVLDERVTVARRALEESYARLAQVQAEQAAAAERERLVRDMHDGIGSALASSLLLAEQGRLNDKATADMLRQCIEDLRLTIDSTDAAAGGDLVTLLATLRFRVGNRLAAAGIAMTWEVGEIPPLPWLTADAALQVLRIVQEALTNVIKHARASRVRLSITQADDVVRVLIEDNGHGFGATDQHAGRGLANQRRRAAAIGAAVEVRSDATGTRVTLDLPIGGPATAAG